LNNIDQENLISMVILASIAGVSRSYLSRAVKHLDLPKRGEDGSIHQLWDLEGAHQVLSSLNRMPESPGHEPYRLMFLNNYPNTWKTTLTINFANYLSLKGYKVLVVDLDGKAASSRYYLGEQATKELKDSETLSAVLRGKKKLKPLIRKSSKHEIDIIPSGYGLLNAELDFARTLIRSGEERYWDLLRGELKTLSDYHVVLIDPPSVFNYLTISALFETNSVVMPDRTDHISLKNLEAQLKLIKKTLQEVETKTEQRRALMNFRFLLSSTEPEDIAGQDRLQKFKEKYGLFTMKEKYEEAEVVRESSFCNQTVFEHEMTTGSHESKKSRENLVAIFDGILAPIEKTLEIRREKENQDAGVVGFS
jgi:chromosome partitioning protein